MGANGDTRRETPVAIWLSPDPRGGRRRRRDKLALPLALFGESGERERENEGKAGERADLGMGKACLLIRLLLLPAKAWMGGSKDACLPA